MPLTSKAFVGMISGIPRHSYLAMKGATQGELMAILGHRSPHMTRRYAHYSQQHLADLLQRANAEL